jgi:hypothetical protein
VRNSGDFYHLCCALHKRLSRADSEFCKQGGLPVATLAIKVFANEVGRVCVWGENVVRPNVPNREESVATVFHCSAMNLKTRLRGSKGYKRGG